MSAPDNDPMPVFEIKGKDRLAVLAVRHYLRLCEDVGLDAQADQTQKALEELIGWQSRNRDLVHFPDHPHVPATDPHPELVDRDGDVWRWGAGYSMSDVDICTRDEIEDQYGPVVERHDH